jgi:hypothetical protein
MDNFESAQPSVVYDGTNYYMFYSGGPSLGWKIGYAYSEDGRVWHKDDENNPVLEPGLTGSWDSESVGYHNVCFNSDSTGFNMWYTGAEAAAFAGNIGYATAPIDPVGIDNDEKNNKPDNFVLYQNFPNPFNPSTTIQYTISETGLVSLRIYNLLGEDVATLVNEEKPAGNHEVEFNAASLSSGLYFYKLQSGSFIEIKKMILMK